MQITMQRARSDCDSYETRENRILKMTREYPRELRWRVVFMLREGWRVADIASVLKVGKTFVRKIRRIFEANQSIEYRPRQGKLKRLSGE